MEFILELLTQVAHGVAVQFGECCEVVIHDLRKNDIDSSIVYIENGHVTERTTGDGPSGIVMEALNKRDALPEDRLAYLIKTGDGRVLKSSTIYIKGDGGKVDYIFSLNYDITEYIRAENALKALTSASGKMEHREETAAPTHSVSELLDTLIDQSVALVGRPVSEMSKEDKIKAIQYLDDAGAFLITKSGDKVSAYFGISKFTLCSYMGNGK